MDTPLRATDDLILGTSGPGVRALKEGDETRRRFGALDVSHLSVLLNTPKPTSIPAVSFVILLFWGSATLI